MQIKTIFLWILLFSFGHLSAKECKVDDRIMFAIATIERHPKTPIGYPFLISLNSSKDQKKAIKNKTLKNFFLDKRTIDCDNKETCVKILSILEDNGIKNLDLGGFQLNYLYWDMKNNQDYFNIKKSYKKACAIVMSHNKNKWTWENIAKYHSKTKKYNESYKKNLLAVVEREHNQ